jgi:hypothetical protein
MSSQQHIPQHTIARIITPAAAALQVAVTKRTLDSTHHNTLACHTHQHTYGHTPRDAAVVAQTAQTLLLTMQYTQSQQQEGYWQVSDRKTVGCSCLTPPKMLYRIQNRIQNQQHAALNKCPSAPQHLANLLSARLAP